DIRTENHTQLDGALIASDSGDLKLDTDTLGFSDIAGHDKEHSYYLNVGGSYGNGQQDQSQQGKGDAGVNGWSVEGHEYERDRQQIVRATVGEGEIVVRNDEQTDTDSTAGLNRDTRKASEITRDEEERTDLYVSKSSVEAVGKAAERVINEIQAQRVSADQVPTSAKQTLGEERAVSVAKNLVRHGLSPDVMASLSPETAQMLATWASAAEDLDQASTGTDTSQAPADSPSSSSANNNGALDLGSVTTIGTVTSGERFLHKTLQLQDYLHTLPLEEAQVVMLGMQALMGPAKAAIGLAGSVLLNAAFGDKIDALKEGAAVSVTAGLTGSDKVAVQAEHEKAKQEYAAGNDEYLNGDGYVLASWFLIDVVAGEIGSLGGKAAGRAIGVVPGAKGSSGAESAINQGRLNSQLLAEEVASGHAFQKHVVERQEFADLGISTKSQFQSFVEKVVSNPAIDRRQAVDGTVYYLDSSTKTIVIRGQRGEATAFRPDKGGVGWENYIQSQVPKK
ncbi:MAG: hypothetical protein ACK5NQ_15565, partial [Pseudomonas sp.]